MLIKNTMKNRQSNKYSKVFVKKDCILLFGKSGAISKFSVESKYLLFNFCFNFIRNPLLDGVILRRQIETCL